MARRKVVRLVPAGAARDPDVVALLEAALVAARSGELQSVAIVGCTRHDSVRLWQARGSQRDAVFKLIGALAVLQSDLTRGLADVDAQPGQS